MTRFRTLDRPAWLPDGIWPFQTFGIPAKDSVLAVTEAGEGPTLLLVHVGAWSIIWRDLVTELAPHFRCVFFDAPGNGQTRSVAKSDVSLEGAADAVAAVIESLDLRRFTLVAHDLGGPAAIAALARMPERVRGIVAMNTFAWRPSGMALRGMLALMGSRVMRELDALTELIPRISQTSFGVGRHMDGPSRRAFRSGMGRPSRRAFHDYLRDARRSDRLYRTVTQALTGSLAHLPLLTIFGQYNDPFGFQKRWKQLYPEARQAVILKGNHFPMCDAPDFVAEAIREWHEEQVARPSGARCFR